jgi:hypothetical protein
MPFDALAWIDTTNRTHRPLRRSCLELANHLGGFFDNAELGTAGFVVTEYLPQPPREAVQQLGLAELTGPGVLGLTLDDTYYLKPRAAGWLNLHFHELVHVLQWQQLGAAGFVARYLAEIAQHGYRQAPLEQMAYGLEQRYRDAPQRPFKVMEEVKRHL